MLLMGVLQCGHFNFPMAKTYIVFLPTKTLNIKIAILQTWRLLAP